MKGGRKSGVVFARRRVGEREIGRVGCERGDGMGYSSDVLANKNKRGFWN
jgi:hypothetical protein